MKKTHKSYKLQDNSIEQEAQELQTVLSSIWKTREAIREKEQELEKLNLSLVEFIEAKEFYERRIIELLKRNNRKSVTLNRVKYYIDGEELKREILLKE